jgi:hypothetical protein
MQQGSVAAYDLCLYFRSLMDSGHLDSTFVVLRKIDSLVVEVGIQTEATLLLRDGENSGNREWNLVHIVVFHALT